MPVTYRPGTFTDVCWAAERGFVQAISGPRYVELGFGLSWHRVEIPVDVLLWLKVAASPDGQVACIGHGPDDHAYLVTYAAVRELGPCYGENSVGLYWEGDWVPVIQRDGFHYSVGGVLESFPFPEGTSQGFRDVRPDGEIIFGDHAHVATVEGVVLARPVTRGQVTVGQIDGTDQIDGVFSGDGMHFLSIPGQAYDPRIAWDGSDSYAVVARTGSGAACHVHPPYDEVPGPEPEPEPERPTCAIASYPASVVQGEPAVATAAYGGGPGTVARWLYKSTGETIWITATHQSPPGRSFDYGPHIATDPGPYHIALQVEGPGGSDETLSERVITVLERTDPEPPNPEPHPEPDPMLYPDAKFQEYIDAAATILQDYRPGRPFAELQQSCREMGDRYRGAATPTNPTVSELFWSDFLRAGTTGQEPIPATELDVVVARLVAEQERLRSH